MDSPNALSIQLFVQEDCLGVYKIAICEIDRCNDGTQGIGKIPFVKNIELESLHFGKINEFTRLCAPKLKPSYCVTGYFPQFNLSCKTINRQ